MEWENRLIKDLQWSNAITNRSSKELAARKIAALAKEGEVIGAGSGSTVYLTLFALAKRIREESLHVQVIPASEEISMTCVRLGISQTTLWDKRPDWTFDGADEVDPAHNLIKGRGGAMFKEKLLIKSSNRNFILVDETKLVNRLGENFPIPVEVFPPALTYVESELRKLGAYAISLRLASGKDGPVLTENGNFILDVRFQFIESSLEERLKSVTGVIESGLFMGYEVEVVTANLSERGVVPDCGSL